ncbi:MAG: hypothetical protein FWC41_13470 [Firmicutes bacterium]|nr:hypothetical protein [Bacillota bacterium]
MSTTITVAGQTLYSMLTIMSSEMEFSLALGQFCIQLGLGMAPAFTAVPPVWTGIEFAPLKALGLGGGSAEQCAQMFATIIDTKFRTGTATNNSSGATVIWS